MTKAGRCPVKDYIDGLSGREAARVSWALDLLEQIGVELGAPHVRHMGDKLWELRVVNAFTKKTSRTARAEVDLAKRRMADYLRRADR